MRTFDRSCHRRLLTRLHCQHRDHHLWEEQGLTEDGSKRMYLAQSLIFIKVL